MKKYLLVLSLLLIIIGCVGLPKPKQLYTACNIWVHNDMKCINYKMGKYIPAGTEVSRERGVFDYRGYAGIFFKTAGHKKTYKMGFVRKWHPGKTVDDYRKYLFTEKAFDELVEGMTGTEIKAIRQGLLVEGMSKKAVLISYGMPPEHKTPSLTSNVWIYWINNIRQKMICFDENDRTIRCHKMTLDGLKPL